MRMNQLFAVGTLFCASILAVGFAPGFAPGAFAQVFPAAAPDHVHMSVPDPDKAVDWYVKHFYGTRVKDPRPNQFDEVGYGDTVFRFFKRDTSIPSDGSVLDRVGFTVSDVDAKVAEIVADGGKVLMPVRPGQNGVQVAFLQDPWGSKIEVLHIPDESNRLFLIALRAPDPDPLLKWVSDTFGGVQDKLMGRFDGLKYGNLWLLVQKSDGDVKESRGHAIDHLGWAVPNMDEAIAMLKSKGYKITTEPRASAPLILAYIEGPNGLAVELTQFPKSGSN